MSESVIRSKGTKLLCVKTLNGGWHVLLPRPPPEHAHIHTEIALHFMCEWGQKCE